MQLPGRGTIGSFPPFRRRKPMNAPARSRPPRDRRTGAARPDPRREPSFQRRPESAQGQPRRRRLLRRRRARCRCSMREACRARIDRRTPRRAATCRSTASPPTTARSQRAAFRCRQPTSSARPRVATVQALGGTGGLKVGADFLPPFRARRAGADQRPELGEPPRPVRKRRVRGQDLPVLRRRRPAASTSTRCWPRCCTSPPERSSSCTPAATTRPAST